MRVLVFFLPILIVANSLFSQENIAVNIDSNGTELQMTFKSGEAHNYPSFAIWLETTDGQFVQTLYATKSVATGMYGYKQAGSLKWEKGPGRAERPAALPYWFHKRDNEKQDNAVLPSPESPVADVYTGATPKNDFVVNLKADKKLEGKMKILVEVNQPWDVNDYWTNAKYPDNKQYLTSCQPALVYSVVVDFENLMPEYYLNPIGHSHPYGADGKLYTNLTTFTTALDIFKSIKLDVK
ncbi:MAG: hypothetical protein C0599_15365 [Salinivirgaceae bacterium]|nr:MAG: hypothetical protein C0599_15365 [Salinivirgaceae bacterium]